MSIVCYTCITNSYDSLKQPSILNSGIDFICFTDSMTASQNGAWRMRLIPNDLQFLDDIKKQRIVKICPHRYLKNYDISIWIDGSIQVIGDLNEFVRQYDLNENPLYTRIHPARDCIYDEADACIKIRKDNKQKIESQVNRYHDAGYPRHIGMVETGIMLRRHNDIRCQMICNEWATELLNNSHRDQLSFNYVCWKNHFVPGILKNEFKINNKFFRISSHG